MYGLVKFWYCVMHDEGRATLHPDLDYSLEQPEWLDICHCDIKCIYDCHGIIEIDARGEMIIHLDVISNKEYNNRYAGGFKREYYEIIYQEDNRFHSMDEISVQLYNYLRS